MRALKFLKIGSSNPGASTILFNTFIKSGVGEVLSIFPEPVLLKQSKQFKRINENGYLFFMGLGSSKVILPEGVEIPSELGRSKSIFLIECHYLTFQTQEESEYICNNPQLSPIPSQLLKYRIPAPAAQICTARQLFA